MGKTAKRENGVDIALLRDLAEAYVTELPYPHRTLARRYLLFKRDNIKSLNELGFLEFLEEREYGETQTQEEVESEENPT